MMPKGTPLTEKVQALRRTEIAQIASRLFFEKGFSETSVREIAEAAGVGKSTLYDYFSTKDDILLTYFENEIQTITQIAEGINQLKLPAYEKLSQLMQAHLAYLLANKQFYLRLTVEMQRLSLESQQRMQVSRHGYQDLICRLIESGIQEGSFRPVDPYLVMRIILASLTPVVFSTRPSASPEQMLATALDIILKGIQA
jgi:AcrR family transcriptional regulator